MWDIQLYEDERERQPVAEWLEGLPHRDRARIDHTIRLLADLGPLLRDPYCMHLRGKIWELRISVARLEYRVLYARVSKDTFLLLHGFTKKTRKTPEAEIEAAERRLDDFLTQNEMGNE